MQKLDNIGKINDVDKIYLFKGDNVRYSLYTDGVVELLDTWITKKPYEFDEFLEGSTTLKRYEFSLSSANILLLEKEYNGKKIRNLYINENKIYKDINTSVFQITINDNNRLCVKKIGRII